MRKLLLILLFISQYATADEIQLNTFQNGEVADADEVNSNFENLKIAIESLELQVSNLLEQSCNNAFEVGKNSFFSASEATIDFSSKTITSGGQLHQIPIGPTNTNINCFEDINTLVISIRAYQGNPYCEVNTTNAINTSNQIFSGSINMGEEIFSLNSSSNFNEYASLNIQCWDINNGSPHNLTIETRFCKDCNNIF